MDDAGGAWVGGRATGGAGGGVGTEAANVTGWGVLAVGCVVAIVSVA